MARTKSKHTKKSAKRKKIELSAMKSLYGSLALTIEPLQAERVSVGNGVFLYSEGDLVIN